ncbi:MAG: hypothetical protein L3J34_07025 [Flavobacteriaceae bacterium]|nr:hypothetical protein [Flavobacteriaceae bacterium]
MTVIAFMFASCGKKTSNSHSHDGEEAHEHAPKTHQHEDGSVHEEHLDEKHQQEEFKVEIDSVSNNTDNHEHNHEDGHQH